MKKIALLFLMGFVLVPTMKADNHYDATHLPNTGQIPTRTPSVSYISITLNETTGLLTMYFYGDVGNVEMTISQNGSVIDYDIIAGSNGGTATYSFSSYAVGEYLLTLETSSGSITQYIITVEDD